MVPGRPAVMTGGDVKAHGDPERVSETITSIADEWGSATVIRRVAGLDGLQVNWGY